MSWAGALFGVAAVIALIGAVGAVGLRSAFHNVLGFAVAMLGVAGVFLSVGHDFLAIVFVLICGGALPVVMVHAVLLNRPAGEAPRPRGRAATLGAAAVAAAGAVAAWLVVSGAPWPPAGGRREVEAAWAGYRFLTDYVLAFELVSVLIAVAMIGAVTVARRRRPKSEG